MRKLTLTQIGPLLPCEHCGAQTYDRKNLPIETVELPDGLTAGNARHHVTMQGEVYRLCANCRYNPPFERY